MIIYCLLFQKGSTSSLAEAEDNLYVLDVRCDALQQNDVHTSYVSRRTRLSHLLVEDVYGHDRNIQSHITGSRLSIIGVSLFLHT